MHTRIKRAITLFHLKSFFFNSFMPARQQAGMSMMASIQCNCKITSNGDIFKRFHTQNHSHSSRHAVGVTYLCVVKFEMGEFKVLKHLDVSVPDQEVSMLLSPALLKRPVLTTLDTPTFYHPETHRITQSHQLYGHVCTQTAVCICIHTLITHMTLKKNQRYMTLTWWS